MGGVVAVRGLEVTAERLAAWDVTAALHGGHRGATMPEARIFIQEAWRRVSRLEVMSGMTRAGAIAAVLAAMGSEVPTLTRDGASGGIVKCQKVKKRKTALPQSQDARRLIRVDNETERGAA
jgi:hypothetical protein